MSQDGSAAMKRPNGLFERIRSFEIFKRCSDNFVRKLASVAIEREAARGVQILKEGEVNERLLMLGSGQVEVQVDGESVAILETPGDLMGEISVLTGRVVTASLHALTDVNFLEVHSHDLEPLIADPKDGFGYFLYSSLSSVLSEKIVRTNDKARRFEIANRALVDAMQSLQEINQTLDMKVQDRTRDLEKKTHELQASYVALETRNTELLASHRKLEELYSTKDMTFKRLSELQESLAPLLEMLTEVESAAPAAHQARLGRAKSQLETSIDILRPMSDLYSTEQAIRSRRVLLCEPDRKQQTVSKLALGGTGVRLDIAATKDDAMELLAAGTRYDIVFVSSELAALIPDLKRKLPSAILVFMASSNVPTEIPVLMAHASEISNIVSRHPEDRTFTVKNVATTVSKLISKDVFGLEKYMIWGVEVQSRKVAGSVVRRGLIEDMTGYFTGLGVRSSIADRAAIVAEELLMNAVYDAPLSTEGKPLYNHLPRTTAVELEASHQPEFKFACDGMLAAISCSDPFGGFRMQTLLDYLQRNYTTTADVVDVQSHGKGGAGRGLHLIIESSDLVVFNVKRNLRTEVIAFFNIDTRSKVEGANPSFHFFLE